MKLNNIFSAKTLNLASVPEIEKAFNSLDGPYSFLDDLYQEKSVRQIKESLFVSPTPKENQVIKVEKKISYTFIPGRYQVVIQNLLNQGTTALECSFKGGSNFKQRLIFSERNESMDVKPNKSWDFIIQILPDEIPYQLEIFKVMDLIDERRGTLLENEENIYKFEIIPGQYRIRLTSRDKAPLSIKINFGGQTESKEPTVYEVFDSNLFAIPTNYPKLFHGTTEAHVIIKNKTKKESKYYLQILQIYGIEELSDIDQRNARILEEEIKKKANDGFVKLDSDLLVSLMYYCQEQDFKSLHQYIKKKYNAITTYKEIEEQTKKYTSENENDFKSLKTFLNTITNFQYSNPQLDVSQFKNSIQHLFDGVLIDEELQRDLEDILDNPKFDVLEKNLTKFEESKNKYKNIPTKELSSLIEKSNEIYSKIKAIFELRDKLNASCEKKSIIDVENALELISRSPYFQLVEKDVIVAKQTLEELIKREETILELNSLMKSATKENANILKNFLNDNRDRLTEYNYKNGFDLYLSLTTVVEEKEVEPNVAVELKPDSKLLSFNSLLEITKMNEEEIQKMEEKRIQEEEEKRIQLEKEQLKRQQEEEEERLKQEETRKAQEIVERKKERKRKREEKKKQLQEEKERKEKEREEKIVLLKQKLKDAKEKRLNAEKILKEQEILIEKEKFKRLNPKFNLVVKSAHELPKMDIGGLSDPYAIIHFGNQSFKTEVIKKTLNPVWDEEFHFNARGYLDDSIQIEIFDWNKLHSDEYMGSAEIPLKTLKHGHNEIQMKLEHSKNPKKSKGSISLEITTVGFGIGIEELPTLIEIPDEYIEMELEDEILTLENEVITLEKVESSDDEESPSGERAWKKLLAFKKAVSAMKEEIEMTKAEKQNDLVKDKEIVHVKNEEVVTLQEDEPRKVDVPITEEVEPSVTTESNEEISQIEFPKEMMVPTELSPEEKEVLLSPRKSEGETEIIYENVTNENEQINSEPSTPIEKIQDEKIQKLIEKKNIEMQKEKKVNEKLVISSQELTHELLTILHRELLRSMYTNESLLITRNSPNSKGLVDAIFNIINFKKKPKYLFIERSMIEIFSNHPSSVIQEIVNYFNERKVAEMTKYLDENMTFLQFILDCNCLVRVLSIIVNDRTYVTSNYEQDSILAGPQYRDDLFCMLDLLAQIKFKLGYFPPISGKKLQEEKEKEIKNLKVLTTTVLQYYLMKKDENIGIDGKEKGTALTNLIRSKYLSCIESICSHGLRYKKFDYKFHIWEIIEAFEANSKVKEFKEMLKSIRHLKLQSNSLKFKLLICFCLK